VAAVREAITDVQVTIREGTGHSIPIEDGNFVAQEIAAFLRLRNDCYHYNPYTSLYLNWCCYNQFGTCLNRNNPTNGSSLDPFVTRAFAQEIYRQSLQFPLWFTAG
jgi:hypothetical protein